MPTGVASTPSAATVGAGDLRFILTPPMDPSVRFQRFAIHTSRFIQFQCIRRVAVHTERAGIDGSFVLACSHLSHLEPFIVAGLLRRPIDYMARIEFFSNRVGTRLLHSLGAFSVDRDGYALGAMRTAIARARAGNVVGIFPEGGVKRGRDSALTGGPIKLGACVVARRAQVPIVPVVVLGAATLNCVPPWLPFKRGRLWVAFGEPIHANPGQPRRLDRLRMGAELSSSFQQLYQELCAAHEIAPAALA